MKAALRLVLEPAKTIGEDVEIAARLEHAGGQHRLWYRLPAAWQQALTPWSDPFVVAFLFPMMEQGGDVRVEGRVSGSLLENLETCMALWRARRPELYHPVHIRPDEEVESPRAPDSAGAIIPFSGGADSCFTAWRHNREREALGRRARTVAAGVVIHGFDIRLNDRHGPSTYTAALAGARAMLTSIGAQCIPVACNFFEVPSYGPDSHGALIISAMHLFAGRFASAMVPNTVPHTQLSTLWGSHPLTDPFLGSAALPVRDDGVECDRSQKLRLLAQWPEAMQHLRVCLSLTEPRSSNCCRCEKCIRTMLAFRLAGVPQPAAFPRELTASAIRRVELVKDICMHYWQDMVLEATQKKLSHTDWAQAMAVPIRRHQSRSPGETIGRLSPLRRIARQFFCRPSAGHGTENERRERAPS